MSKIAVCYTVFYAVFNGIQHVAGTWSFHGSFPGFRNILSLTDVITCRFAIKMSIGLQMRNARNLREIYPHRSLSENEVSRSAFNGLFTKK